MYGVILLVMDTGIRIDGAVRKRMLVSSYRYRYVRRNLAGDGYRY